MYRSGGIKKKKKMEEEIDLYFFRCYDEDKYDQRRVKMKKILASLMMVGLIFCLGGCNVPWMKQKTEKTKAAKVIQADKVEGTMKGMKLKVGVSNDMAPFSYYDSEQKKITGFDIDLLDKLSEYLGFEYELYPMNMKEIRAKRSRTKIRSCNRREFQSQMKDREFSFTDTYYETYLQIVVRKDSQITDRKEITEKKVGVVEGTSSAQYAEDYLSEDNKITYYKNITKVWNDLEKERSMQRFMIQQESRII